MDNSFKQLLYDKDSNKSYVTEILNWFLPFLYLFWNNCQSKDQNGYSVNDTGI